MLGGGLLWTLYRQRWRMLVTVVVAGLLAAGLVALLDDVARPEGGRDPLDLGVDAGPVAAEGFPTAPGIAVVAAVLTAAAPWLSRRWRRAGWVLLLGLLVTRFLATPVSFDSLEAALLGWVAGAGVLVAFGAPSRRPTSDAVADGALRSRARARAPRPGERRRPGVHALLRRRIRRQQASSSRRSATTSAAPTSSSASTAASPPRLRRREAVHHPPAHRRARGPRRARRPRPRRKDATPPGLRHRRPERVRAGLRGDRRPVARSPRRQRDHRRRACRVLDLVGQLRRHRIAHRDLRLANIFLDDDGIVWLIDFGFSEMAASDLLLANDVAELIASSSLPVGPERAVAHAASGGRSRHAGTGARSAAARGRSAAPPGLRSSRGEACSTSFAGSSVTQSPQPPRRLADTDT